LAHIHNWGPFRSSSGLVWGFHASHLATRDQLARTARTILEHGCVPSPEWGGYDTVIECHPPGDCYSVDYGVGLDGPLVTIDTP
jgi:hypothetical protein